MNILFLTLGYYPEPDKRTIYCDLAEEFAKNGHKVYVTCAAPRRGGHTVSPGTTGGVTVLKINTGGIVKTNIIKKGILTVLLPRRIKKAVKYLYSVKFDLVLCSTPPVTFAKVIKYIKARDSAATYLMVKDIFPQNAVDLGLLSKTGFKRPIYLYFRRKERELYRLSDYIGCMSQANADYILKHNHYLKPSCVEVCPNSIKIMHPRKPWDARARAALNLPEDTVIFIFGGNLSKPQGIVFLIQALRLNINKPDRFFVICGTGTEYKSLQDFIKSERPRNIMLINGLPKQQYNELLSVCDIGLICLDHRFTVPNFPSRILSYMEFGLPVIAFTDKNTDIRDVLQAGGFGWWRESNDAGACTSLLDEICNNRDEIAKRGVKAAEYLEKHYDSETTYRAIMKHFANERDLQGVQ
jgi:glycosyltransferase involved in cell wall biosynthesis